MNTQNPERLEPPNMEFDGGQLDVLWNNHNEAIEWYARHLGWSAGQTETWNNDLFAAEAKMTPLKRHDKGTIWLHSLRSDRPSPHFFADRDSRKPNIRWCFDMLDLEDKHAYFKTNGVPVSPIYSGPGQLLYFDFYSFDGTLLTCMGRSDSESPLKENDGNWVTIGVGDLGQAISWYQQYVGMNVVAQDPSSRSVMMGLASGKSRWWLHEVSLCSFAGPVNGAARPYMVIRGSTIAENYRQVLNEHGVATSVMNGNPPLSSLSTFHFYDPWGNRLNYWTY